MRSKIFGENYLRFLNLNYNGKQELASGPYEYYFYRTGGSETLTISELGSFTIFVLDDSSGLSVSYPGCKNQTLRKFDAVQSEKIPLTVKASGGCVFLVSGTNEMQDELSENVSILAEEELYKVNKPWGYEIWINGSEHPGYCLKKISINQGNRTSLQYHRFKQETNVIFEGHALLHYKKDSNVINDDVIEENINQVGINAVTAIDVKPNTIHRIESKTDILLYEVSTPHLDDVVHLQDDSKRSNGRIEEEHVNNG